MKHIFEGVDGTFKTTMAKSIGGEYKHNNLIPKDYRDIITGVESDFEFIDNDSFPKYTLDRSFIISEYIYSRSIAERITYLTMPFVESFIKECAEKSITINVNYFEKEETIDSMLTIKKDDFETLPIHKINKLYVNFFVTFTKYKNIYFRKVEDYLNIKEPWNE
jgi:hypothetical protein